MSTLSDLRSETRRFFAENHLQVFPIRHHLKGYSAGAFRKDLRAGLDVALLGLPQGMAYAAIAGLPPVQGIVCAAVAAIVGPFFASSRLTVPGPTNATAFMVGASILASTNGAAVLQQNLLLMPLLVLMVGLLLVIGAVFRFADLIQYISRSVVVGYVTGAAILISVNQLKHVLGFERGLVSGKTFFGIVASTWSGLSHTQAVPLGLALGTIVLFWFLRKKLPRFPAFAGILVFMSAVGFYIDRSGLLGRIGGHTPTLDQFSADDIGLKLESLGDGHLFEHISPLMGIAIAIAFLAALENSIMGKTLGSRTGQQPDMNQDMFGLGVTNIFTGLFSGMPASGSPTRSALNHESGSMSPVSTIFSGLLCLIGAFTLGHLAGYVPTSVLAALIICIAASLINRRNLRICFNATRSDAAVLVVTIFSTLLMPLHVAIFVGVGVSVILYLRKAAQPQLVEYEFNDKGDLLEAEGGHARRLPGISIVHVEGDLFFGAAELFRTQIQRTAADPNLRVIILRLKNARHLDATSVMALEELIKFLSAQGRFLLVSGAMRDVYKVLRNSGMIEVIGRDNIFMGVPSNPNISTKNALKRAQTLLGTTDAEVHIFYDPSKS
ncbi:MAG: SulP family inorganic anion transporter [Verrucomicrobiae bacterium]|nr:SulP family inorganic anion transporter [Verrucomicrobiae bacterium]